MKISKFIVLALSITSFICYSQNPSTSSSTVENALQQKEALMQNSLVKNIAFSNIGPTVMSGRVTDLAVSPENPTEFYVAYASGGVWHTTNNGSSFKPILDHFPTKYIESISRIIIYLVK